MPATSSRPSPSRIRPTSAPPRASCSDVKLTRAYIGSCTGGKLTDFVNAAQVMRGHKVAVKTFLVPATTEISDAIRTEMLDGRTLALDLRGRRAARSRRTPRARPVSGVRSDTFGRINGPEVCISTTNRNFPGRMGAKEGQVYLASPYTVAASAITGRITDPREFLS